MTEDSDSGGKSSGDNASSTISSQVIVGQLFGPFPDPLQWLAFKSSESVCPNNSNSYNQNDLFASVEIARHSGEQNMEIVHKNGQFYFKALQDIQTQDSDNPEFPKLYAWFNKELNDKLPAPSSSTINGSKRYFCALCNEVFLHPNPVVIHLLFSCSKRNQISSINQPEPSRNSVPINTSQLSSLPINKLKPTTKKRGFDIASLVKEESDDGSLTKYQRNELETDIRAGEDAAGLINASAFHKPKSPTSRHIPDASNSMPQSSAFKKVDYKTNQIQTPYDFTTIYHRVAAASVLMPPTTHPSLLPALSSHNSLPPPLSTSSAKSLVSNSLLPYLPPSLAALSFPTSNWCAKCNATFRMTSDLVYHMRSHHKNANTVDPLKKKREDKLRCNICHETFRERHHLTRHMTSHQ